MVLNTNRFFISKNDLSDIG